MNDHKKLNNQPLKLVLAEFRFSVVMQIEGYIPKLQEILRKKYPISDEKTQQALHFQPDRINMSTLKNWSFISKNKKSAITINQERLIYYTAEYERFEGFSEACKHGLEALASIIEPSLIFRIGLRYGDLAKIDEGEEVSSLVDPFFGFPKCIESLGDSQYQSSETVIDTEVGSLIIKTLYGKHNLTCLPDIQDLPITIEKDNLSSERIILDFDHFWEPKDSSVSFETNEILLRLDSLHKTSREAFWKVTSDYARNEKWS